MSEPSQVPVANLLALAEHCDGDDYVFGAKAPGSDRDPEALDCSGLVSWDCNRLGVIPAMPDGAVNQCQHCIDNGGEISVEEALKTQGALLFRIGVNGDHVVFSLGDGNRTFEARGKDYGVGYFDGAADRIWTHGAKIPGVDYAPAR